MNKIQDKTNIFTSVNEIEDQLQKTDLDTLTGMLEKYAPYDDTFALSKYNVQIIKESKPSKVKQHMLSQPGICLVPQGAKQVSTASETFEYGESSMVVYSAGIPISTKVTKASKDKPFFCLVIPIDAQKLGELIVKVFPNGLPRAENPSPFYMGKTNPKIIKSSIRLMELITQQEDVDLLLPLVIDEILIRLLRSPAGASIAQIGIADSHSDKISKSIEWLKTNYKNNVKIEEMAKIAGMSISSFHTHFKELTRLSPLQFQKKLRLQAARNLIKNKMTPISAAAYDVGYVSSSQFSREYSREFGISPAKDQHSIL